ncbi:MAG: 16S rRNA (guanine(527)-N(7))-methyltransferase RsmG [Candidatus Caenarcaniphilales bacterium]|nr:16S rRNA (guanine(527)-N(7))-methyltransferase RsmG [Candidatus Caenarcaniphilales bacterium]
MTSIGNSSLNQLPKVHSWNEAKTVLCDYLSINLNDWQHEKLSNFHALLQETNKVINLTRLDSLSDFLTFHLVDTALLIPSIRELSFRNNKKLQYLDLGSGCGVPGIILHILLKEEESKFSDIKTTLVDSISKRTRFLTKVVQELELTKSISVITARAESLTDQHKNFDLVTARAFAKPQITLNTVRPFLSKRGFFLAQTTEKISHLAKVNNFYAYSLAEKQRLISTVMDY